MTNVGEAWSEYYKPGMSSEEAQAFKAGFAAALGTIQWEYGTRWHVPGDPDARFSENRVDRIVDYVEDSREIAERLIADDREARPEGKPGILLRRPVFDSPWEEVDV